jgi:NAD(P)-dependent dehydrogenase (short-subunit alcohol dehydrogenase family)
MEIKGCVGLVTGGNRGIGEAFVRVLLESGAQKVYAGSRDPAARASRRAVSRRCIALELDVDRLRRGCRAARIAVT